MMIEIMELTGMLNSVEQQYAAAFEVVMLLKLYFSVSYFLICSFRRYDSKFLQKSDTSFKWNENSVRKMRIL